MALWEKKKAQHASSPSSTVTLGEDWVTQCAGLGKVPSRPCLSRSQDDIDALRVAQSAGGRRTSRAEIDPWLSGAGRLGGFDEGRELWE